MIANPGFLTDLSVQSRQDLVVEAYRRVCEAQAVFAQLVGVAEEAGDHRADGQPDMACWLRQQFGPFHSTARTWSKVGRASLKEHQAPIVAMWAGGHLSEDQVTQAVKLVDLDARWAEMVQGFDAGQLARAYSLYRERKHDETRAPSSVKKFWDEINETLRLRAQLQGLDAATIDQALEQEVRRLSAGYTERGEKRPSWDELYAVALANICSRDLGRNGDLDRTAVGVNVSAEFLCRGTGVAAEITGGGPLSHDELMAMLPGARIELRVEQAGGHIAIARGRIPKSWVKRWLPDVAPDERPRPPVTLTITMPAAFAGGGALSGDGHQLIPDEALRQLLDLPLLRWIRPGPDGELGVGRTSMEPPPWLRRLIRGGDRACRLCGRQGWLHIHHVKWWRLGGRTSDANLVALCGACHRLVHRGEFRLRGDPRGHRLWLVTRYGRRIRCRRILRM